MRMQHHIESTLTDALTPLFLSVENESHLHSSSTPDSESHFKVTVVSDVFAGERLIARHRRINALLADALQSSVHALALHTFTPEEWLARSAQIPDSTKCAGH